jgi:hypothetical protein
MLPTTSSKITLHCSTYKGNFSFKAGSVQLHYSKIGQKKFTQSTSYLSIEFSLTFPENQWLILPLHPTGFLPGDSHRKSLWLSAGFEEFDLTTLCWGINGQIHAQRVPGICITGSQLSLKIDTLVPSDSPIGFPRKCVPVGTRPIIGMNAEFRGAFKHRVTGRLLRESEIGRQLTPMPKYALV